MVVAQYDAAAKQLISNHLHHGRPRIARGKLPEQPPPAVVPPASIAGDELSIEALTAARRAVRAQQRLVKHAGASQPAVQQSAQQQPVQQSSRQEQPLAQHFSLSHPQRSTALLQSASPQQADDSAGPRYATAAAEVREADAADAVGTGVMQLAAENRQPEGQEAGTSDAAVAGQEASAVGGAAADGALVQPRTQLQRQLQQLRLQSQGLPLDEQPAALMQQQPGVITRPAQTSVQPRSQPANAELPAVAPQARQVQQPQPQAAAGEASTTHSTEGAAPHVAEAAPGAAPAAVTVKAADGRADAEASRTAWQRVMDSMAAAPTTVRGGVGASWQTLQSLPQGLPKALPQLRLPWQPPGNGATGPGAEVQQPTARQRLMDQISGLELRPMAQDVLPDQAGSNFASELAYPKAAGTHRHAARQRPTSYRRVPSSSAAAG